jgi:membrane-bound serine protease (ClpP class)
VTPFVLIVALLVCGMVLLVVEVAIIPGFGVAGLGAIAMIVGGTVLAWVRYGATWGMGSLLIAAGATYTVLVVAPRTRAGKQLILADAVGKGGARDAALVGKVGRTITALRPAGVADVDGRRVDVVAEGVFVDAGREVRIVSVEGARVVVEPVEAKAAGA